MYSNCKEIKNVSTTGKKSSFSTWYMWRNLKFSTCMPHATRVWWKNVGTYGKFVLFCCKIIIYTLCREICFVAIYALLCGERLSQNFSLWRKNFPVENFQLSMYGNCGEIKNLCHYVVKSIKVPKYLEWVFECSKKHSEKKTSSKKHSTN